MTCWPCFSSLSIPYLFFILFTVTVIDQNLSLTKLGKRSQEVFKDVLVGALQLIEASHDTPYMWNLKRNYINKFTKQRLTDLENALMVAGGKQ